MKNETLSQRGFFSKVDRVMLPFVLSLGIPIVAFAVHTNPSGAPPGTPFESWVSVIALSVGGAAVSYILHTAVLSKQLSRVFSVALIVSFCVHVALQAVLANVYHRDFYALFFVSVYAHIILVIQSYVASIETNAPSRPAPVVLQTARGVTIVAAVVTSIVGVWVLMMGYAISTRQEPRWAESIYYNAYLVTLVLVAVWQIAQLRRSGRRTLRVGPGAFETDGHDFSSVLGETNLRIINSFLDAPDGRLSCRDIALASAPERTDLTAIQIECAECIEMRYTASNCRRYRTIYNRILDVRKLLESLEIGTILAPQNKMKVSTEGWKLLFFHGVDVKRKV